MKWRIDEIETQDGVITAVKYHISHVENEQLVEAEGNWTFRKPHSDVPFESITEELVISWIQEDEIIDGNPVISGRILEQHKELAKEKVVAPWKPQIFIPNIKG
jgi:hypothetical protein